MIIMCHFVSGEWPSILEQSGLYGLGRASNFDALPQARDSLVPHRLEEHDEEQVRVVVIFHIIINNYTLHLLAFFLVGE